VQFDAATRRSRIWTTLDVDRFVMVTAGCHFVNRLSYVITERAFDPSDEIEIVDPKELEDYHERIASGGVR
jgi:hypothetical protein